MRLGRSRGWAKPFIPMPSHLRARPREIAYALRLARVRQSAFNFLQDGTLLAPPLVETEEEEIPMSRLSIYAGQQEALKEFVQRVPLTLASVWRAWDGKIGIAVTSIADRPLSPTLTLDLARYGLRQRGRIYALDALGAAPMGEFKGKALVLKLDLAPLDVRVFEVRAP